MPPWPCPRGRRPLELQLLGLAPEPWTPIDSLAIGKLFAWRLGENHRAELLRYALAEELGPRAARTVPRLAEWAPLSSWTRADRAEGKRDERAELTVSHTWSRVAVA